jgi:FAD binding domain
MIAESAVQHFRSSLRGQSFCPGDPGYDEARTIPNAMIDRRPAIIGRCAGAADVIACVRFARDHSILVSVRGGGHSIAGKAVCDGGLMVDMSAMKGIRVDPARRTVRAQTGLKLGEFDRETQAFGLATTQGVVPTVGIAGLTLGGGWGNLHGKFGLSIDNVISADVVWVPHPWFVRVRVLTFFHLSERYTKQKGRAPVAQPSNLKNWLRGLAMLRRRWCCHLGIDCR